MIPKKEMLVITFYTTTAAMAMEHLCKQHSIEGRIIPVPGSISADCGLAWCAKPEAQADLLRFMETHQIQSQGLYRCLV